MAEQNYFFSVLAEKTDDCGKKKRFQCGYPYKEGVACGEVNRHWDDCFCIAPGGSKTISLDDLTTDDGAVKIGNYKDIAVCNRTPLGRQGVAVTFAAAGANQTIKPGGTFAASDPCKGWTDKTITFRNPDSQFQAEICVFLSGVVAAPVPAPPAPVPPVIAAVSDQVLCTTSPVSIQMTATGTTPVTWSATGLPVGLTISGTTGLISGQASSNTIADVVVTATNPAGSNTESFKLTFTSPSPTIGPIANLNLLTNVAITPVQLTAAGGAPITFSMTPAPPAGMTLSPEGLLQGTPQVSGSATYTVTAKNACGESTGTFTINVTDPVAPIVAAIPDQSLCNTLPVNIQPTATGTLPITWSAVGLPAPLVINASTGQITGNPVGSTNNPINITATNAAGSGVGVFQLSIVDGAPVIVDPPDQTFTQGTPITPVQLAVTSGGSPLTYTVSPALPTGLTLSPQGLLSGTPAAVIAATDFTFTATNACGASSAVVSMTVNANCPPPTLAAVPASIQIRVGQAMAPFQLQATGLAPLTYTLSGAVPAGITVDPNTGIISGTPTGATGTFVATATVTNGCGATATQTVSFNLQQSTPFNINLLIANPTAFTISSEFVPTYSPATPAELSQVEIQVRGRATSDNLVMRIYTHPGTTPLAVSANTIANVPNGSIQTLQFNFAPLPTVPGTTYRFAIESNDVDIATQGDVQTLTGHTFGSNAAVEPEDAGMQIGLATIS